MGTSTSVYLLKGIRLKGGDIGENLEDELWENEDMEKDGVDFLYSEYSWDTSEEGCYWIVGKIISSIHEDEWEEIDVEEIPTSRQLKTKIEDVLKFSVEEEEIKLYHFKHYS